MKYCIKCGKGLTEREKFCPQCGYHIDKQKNRKIEFVILLSCIFTIVVGIFSHHLFYKKDDVGMSVSSLFHNKILNLIMDTRKEKNFVKSVSSHIDIIEEEFQELEEGSYKLITENYEYLSGDIAVVKDYKDIAYADMYINIADETFCENFRWDNKQRLYEMTNESKTCCFKVIQKNGQLVGLLQYIGKKNYEFIFKKYNGLDGVNATLAVREYFEQKDDGIQYAFKTSNFQTLYAEIYMIPVFQVKNDKLKELYTVMVTSREYSKPGIARVYFSEDIKEVMDGEKELSDISALEEFDAYQFFAFEGDR